MVKHKDVVCVLSDMINNNRFTCKFSHEILIVVALGMGMVVKEGII